jgi:hypothetical protein
MGTITKMVQYHMENFRQTQMRLDTLTQLGWGDAANYFRERDMKYGTAELNFLAVVKLQIHITAATASWTTAGEHMQTLAMVRGQLEIPEVTSQAGSSQLRLGSEKPQSNKFIPAFLPNVAANSMAIQDAKPVGPLSFYPCMKHP